MSGLSLMTWLSGPLLISALTLWLLNRQIRTSLAAPRVCESGVPDGLPWREVSI